MNVNHYYEHVMKKAFVLEKCMYKNIVIILLNVIDTDEGSKNNKWNKSSKKRKKQSPNMVSYVQGVCSQFSLSFALLYNDWIFCMRSFYYCIIGYNMTACILYQVILLEYH